MLTYGELNIRYKRKAKHRRKEMADLYRNTRKEHGPYMARQLWKRVRAATRLMIDDLNRIAYGL